MDKGGLSRIKMLVFSRDFKARDVFSFIKIGVETLLRIADMDNDPATIHFMGHILGRLILDLSAVS